MPEATMIILAQPTTLYPVSVVIPPAIEGAPTILLMVRRHEKEPEALWVAARSVEHRTPRLSNLQDGLRGLGFDAPTIAAITVDAQVGGMWAWTTVADAWLAENGNQVLLTLAHQAQALAANKARSLVRELNALYQRAEHAALVAGTSIEAIDEVFAAEAEAKADADKTNAQILAEAGASPALVNAMAAVEAETATDTDADPA